MFFLFDYLKAKCVIFTCDTPPRDGVKTFSYIWQVWFMLPFGSCATLSNKDRLVLLLWAFNGISLDAAQFGEKDEASVSAWNDFVWLVNCNNLANMS